jgi:hypothetical protein
MVDGDGAYGRYCSEHCKQAAQISELRCDCQHLECRMGSHPAPASAAGADREAR